MPGEFDLIRQYFVRPVPSLLLGPGDDCALMNIPPGRCLATSTDTLLQGRHFFSDVAPGTLGHKALAVNLSDLAAMGATPLGCLLNLAIPEADPDWLAAFSDGFLVLADEAACPLAGGDTVRSRDGIMITVTVLGHVMAEQALRRDAAQPGDDVWMTGELGAAALALAMLGGDLPMNATTLAETRDALERPRPPLDFAARLCGVARAAIDVSDGLAQDLGHVLKASGCGAVIELAQLPVHPALHNLEPQVRDRLVLGGGDVYQLCFTAAPGQRQRIHALADGHRLRVTRIGHITPGSGLQVQGVSTTGWHDAVRGFDHFQE